MCRNKASSILLAFTSVKANVTKLLDHCCALDGTKDDLRDVMYIADEAHNSMRFCQMFVNHHFPILRYL